MRAAEIITRQEFLSDRQGKTFEDVLHDFDISFDEILKFFNDPARQQRMEDAEIHHARPPLAGVIREFEAVPAVAQFFETIHRRRSARVRQAIGVLVRMIMERRGWQTTGKKGSLGVRRDSASEAPAHNTGGLSLWFLRAERYQRHDGMPFMSVRKRSEQLGRHDDAQTESKPAKVTKRSNDSGLPRARQ